MASPKIKVQSHTKNVVVIPKGIIIEITSDHFTSDSPVFFPYGSDISKPTALEAIKSVLTFAQEFPRKKLFITGHVDSSATPKNGFSLSSLRSKAAYAILSGKSDSWVKIAKLCTVTHYKRLLLYFDKKYSWNCDPKSSDDTKTTEYSDCIKNYKTNFNTQFKPKQLLTIDDKIDTKTLSSFFQLYQQDLATLLGEADIKNLVKWFKLIKFISAANMSRGCGTSIQKQTPATNGMFSANGNRIEFIFFNEKSSPKLNCIASLKADHLTDKCPVASKAVTREYLDPQNVSANAATLLSITAVDDHFAPQAETLKITYDIKDLSDKTVVMQITSDTYTNNPIYERVLTNGEKSDGTGKTIEWNGETTCDGDLKGLFVNPLFSPYNVTLKSVSGAESFKEFKILYGNIILSRGPWDAGRPAASLTPDEKTETTDWIRYKLNELGYWGGPSTNNESGTTLQSTYLKKAASFYARNNVKLYNRGKFNADAAIQGKDNLFMDCLRNNESTRVYFEDPSGDVFTNAASGAKCFVPSLYYTNINDFYAGGESRSKKDHALLNEPVIPVLAKVQILDKSNNSVDAPEAVGKVKLSWHLEDCAETDRVTRYEVHVSHLADNRFATPPAVNDPDIHPYNVGNVPPTDDTQRLLYMDEIVNWIQTKSYSFSDKTPLVKNCPSICGGKTKLSALFLSYRPFTLDTKGKRPLSETSVLNEVLGKTGVYFCPSAIGGDSYQICVDYDFSNQKNKNALNTEYAFNAATNSTKHAVKTGVFTIWRDAPFNTIIKWPGCSNIAEYELDRIRQNYEQAYINMSVPTAANEIVISTIIKDPDYLTMIKKFKSESLKNIFKNKSFASMSAADRKTESDRFVKDSSASKANIASWKLSDKCVYGKPLPAQNNIPGANYQHALKALFYNDTSGFIYSIIDDMATITGKKFREKIPYGHAIIAFYPHEPVQILTDPVNQPGVVSNAAYVAGFVSMGQADGIVTYDLGDTDRRGYVITHEFGHHNFLYHHENAGDTNPRHHDLSDHNCMMSYPGGIAPAISSQSNPLFCGKCNLRLRGWQITSKNVPASS